MRVTTLICTKLLICIVLLAVLVVLGWRFYTQNQTSRASAALAENYVGFPIL